MDESGQANDRAGLTVDVEDDGDYRIVVGGELDLNSCGEFENALESAFLTDAGRIVIDLDGLVFVDSTGLQSLLRAKRRAEAAGDGRLRMTRGRGEVARLLKLTALDMVLPFDDEDGR